MWIGTHDCCSMIKADNIEKIYTELVNLKTKDDCWSINVIAYLKDEDEPSILETCVLDMNFAGCVVNIIHDFLFTVITKGIDVNFARLSRHDLSNPLQKSDLKFFTEELIKCVDDEYRADMFLVVGIL